LLKKFLAEKGYDPNLGARPLKRVIQKEVLNPLSMKIVSGEIKPGEKVVIDFRKEKIKFITVSNGRKDKKSLINN
jgi:ATP-dependent Clp protease ATP-binding subunit ClpA